jgi:hypothetical protein
MKFLPVAASVVLRVAIAKDPVTVQANPEGEQAAAVAHDIAEHASACFMNNQGNEAGYRDCSIALCHRECRDSNTEECQTLCGDQAVALFQKFTVHHPDEPVTVQANPEGEQAAAVAHDIAEHASACFMNNQGNEAGYRDCSTALCHRECRDSNTEECQTLCGDQAGALFQKFVVHQREKRAGGSFLAIHRSLAPEDDLAKEMTHDLEMNFNKIAPFGKEDTAKELQDHAAKTQDTLVDAVENAEVAEIKRAVFRALTRLRAATIKEFDTIARLETQAIDAYNDAHHYRAENPLAHLHEDEAPVETDKLKSFH